MKGYCIKSSKFLKFAKNVSMFQSDLLVEQILVSRFKPKPCKISFSFKRLGSRGDNLRFCVGVGGGGGDWQARGVIVLLKDNVAESSVYV